MSTVEQKPPMTREEWESAMAEIHAKLDTIPEDIPTGWLTPDVLLPLVLWVIVFVVFHVLRDFFGIRAFEVSGVLGFLAGMVAGVCGYAIASRLARRLR